MRRMASDDSTNDLEFLITEYTYLHNPEILIEHKDFKGVLGRMHRHPIVVFERSAELEALTYKDCAQYEKIVLKAYPEWRIHSKWNGPGFHSYSIEIAKRNVDDDRNPLK